MAVAHPARTADVPIAGAVGVRRTVLTVAIGETLVQFGLSPVTAVMPSLAAAVGVDTADGAWILTVFILALAGSLLVFGRLGDLVGHHRIFGLGALLYTIASLAAGLSTGFGMLLGARIAQGVGAAMVSGNNLAILARAVPPESRGRAIAVIATASSLAAVVGSGLATAAVALGGWPLVFFGAAPLSLWAALRARRLPGGGASPKRAPVDWAGAALLVVTTTLVAIVLNHPHTETSEAVMPLFHGWLPVLALLSGAAFVLVERRVGVPLLDWGQLRNGPFASAIGVNLILHLTMMAAMFLGPVLVVRGMGMSATAGGMLMVVVQASVTLTALLGGWLHDRTRAGWIRPVAAAVLTAGFAAWAVAGLEGSYGGVLAAGALGGLGLGVLLAVNNAVIMGALPADARGVASGMLETTRHFGHALGVTIPTAIVAFVTAALSGRGGEALALRVSFFWACLAMALIAAAGVGLALIRPRQVA
jgi:MFS family permease